MLHIFDNLQKRNRSSLDGIWYFIAGDGDFSNGITGGEDIYVPSCWNTNPKYFSYEGIAWYETKVYSQSPNVRFVFEGVLNECDIYLDGEKIGYHYGGFTEFTVDAFGIKPGEHRLSLKVDNTHSDTDTIPLSRCDWYHYGGIARSVSMIELPSAFIDDYVIKYELSGDLTSARLQALISLRSFEKCELSVSLKLEDRELKSMEVTVDGRLEVELSDMTVDNPRLWDIGCGELYTAEISIGCDSIFENIGFRKIEARGREIYLNNRKIKLRGVNRHDEHPDWGFSMPPALIKRDIDIILNMGCNTVRGSHYPNSRATLDLCDRCGLLFMEEIPLWGYQSPKLVGNPIIIDRGINMHREMVKRDIHRPCVIFWSLHNEIDTKCEEGFALTKKFKEAVVSLDTSRLITYATSFPFEDICLSLCDVACVNSYQGWYEGRVSDWAQFMTRFRKKLEDEGLEIPFVMTEFGAGAIYGTHSFDKQIWSEEFQEGLLRDTLEAFVANDDLAGTYIWQFCDIRSSKPLELLRPRNFNNKGLLNEYRQPKLAYSAAAKIYRSEGKNSDK